MMSCVLRSYSVHDCFFARGVSRVRAICTVPRLEVRALVSNNDMNILLWFRVPLRNTWTLMLTRSPLTARKGTRTRHAYRPPAYRTFEAASAPWYVTHHLRCHATPYATVSTPRTCRTAYGVWAVVGSTCGVTVCGKYRRWYVTYHGALVALNVRYRYACRVRTIRRPRDVHVSIGQHVCERDTEPLDGLHDHVGVSRVDHGTGSCGGVHYEVHVVVGERLQRMDLHRRRL